MSDLITSNQAKSKKAAGGGSVDESKLDEYTETLLKIFDSNKDGKLQLNEMSK